MGEIREGSGRYGETEYEQLCEARERLLREQTPEALWEVIRALEGVTFYTAKGLEYSYTIRGKEMFVSRKEKSVTSSSIWMAYQKALELKVVTGPKQLGVFGASYLYPVFQRLGII